MHVRKETLLAALALVWTLAGANVLRLGILAYPRALDLYHLIGSLIVFVLFKERIFTPLVHRHLRRIGGLETPRLHQFFDRRSFFIMAGMIGLGVGLRLSGLVPVGFIAFFYSGLGAALAYAGLAFGFYYLRALTDEAWPAHLDRI